jgi:hypothetical protein
MSAAPIVLTDIRICAIDQAPHQKIELPARACLSGSLALRSTTASEAERRFQNGSRRHRQPIDGTEVTERTPV